MRIIVNAVASTAGGGKTYLGNLLAWLRSRDTDEFEVWVPESDSDQYAPVPSHIRLRTSRLAHAGFLGRLLWEQIVLPWRLRSSGQVLLCLGNFCPLWSPIPVVLLSANALYFCRRFVDDLRYRCHYTWIIRHRLKGRMVLASARAADVVVTPTQAMADQLSHALRRPLGTQRTLWFGHHPRSAGPPATPLLSACPNEIRFAIVSFYNYFRNFETVFRALAILKKTSDLTVRLVLTTDLEPGLKLGGYDTTSAYKLVRELDITDRVTCTGHVPYDELPGFHASVDGLIAAGYVESFSFTVVEGMAAGLPVLASDIPTHREVGGDAALYFRPLDAEHLAEQWLRMANDAQLRRQMAAAGRERSRHFDWDTHFQELLRLTKEAAGSK